MNIRQQSLNTKIDSLARSEKVTKAKLGVLSRDLLSYVVLEDSRDIGMVNRLLGVLTPMNKGASILFFKAMLPWHFDEDTGLFTKMTKKTHNTKKNAIVDFLLVDENDIWKWLEDNNIKPEKKEPNYLKNISNNVKKALEHGGNKLEILAAVLEGGVELDELIELMGDVELV